VKRPRLGFDTGGGDAAGTGGLETGATLATFAALADSHYGRTEIRVILKSE
jgi:hypothetical protein